MQTFKILVFVFSLIALILAREIKIIDDISDNVSEIVPIDKTYQALPSPRALPPEIKFDITDEDSFRRSITSLREAVSSPTPQVPNMRTISPGQGNSLTLITFNVGSEEVQLVMRNENLYIAGFIINQQFYRFADFGDITINGTRVVPGFTMESNYIYLTGSQHGWGQPLERLTIGPLNIESAVYALINYHNNPSNSYNHLALPMLRLILLTSESIRFNAIETEIVSSYQTYVDFTLSEGANVLRNWNTFSTYGNRLASNTNLNERHDTRGYGVLVGEERRTEVTRSTLYFLLAVALCGKISPRNYGMRMEEVCSDEPGDEVVLINNKYWFKATIVATIL